MPKFPKDAPKAKVLRALESLGFQVVREKEHISMSRRNEDGTETPLTLPNTVRSKHQHCDRSAHKPTFHEKNSFKLMKRVDTVVPLISTFATID